MVLTADPPKGHLEPSAQASKCSSNPLAVDLVEPSVTILKHHRLSDRTLQLSAPPSVAIPSSSRCKVITAITRLVGASAEVLATKVIASRHNKPRIKEVALVALDLAYKDRTTTYKVVAQLASSPKFRIKHNSNSYSRVSEREQLAMAVNSHRTHFSVLVLDRAISDQVGVLEPCNNNHSNTKQRLSQ